MSDEIKVHVGRASIDALAHLEQLVKPEAGDVLSFRGVLAGYDVYMEVGYAKRLASYIRDRKPAVLRGENPFKWPEEMNLKQVDGWAWRFGIELFDKLHELHDSLQSVHDMEGTDGRI